MALAGGDEPRRGGAGRAADQGVRGGDVLHDVQQVNEMRESSTILFWVFVEVEVGRKKSSLLFLPIFFSPSSIPNTQKTRSKIGQYHVMVCGTTPCRLSGAELVMKAISERQVFSFKKRAGELASTKGS